jgi:hypothetical protein
LKHQLLTLCTGLLLAVTTMPAQSTYGTILGTVKDSSGAAVPGAVISLTSLEKNETLTAKSNSVGDYEFLNLLPAHYTLSVVQSGFENFSATNILLVSRQTLRIDAALQVGQISQQVTVNETEVGTIATDSQVIQETFTPQQLMNLPANVRAGGNTSRITSFRYCLACKPTIRATSPSRAAFRLRRSIQSMVYRPLTRPVTAR